MQDIERRFPEKFKNENTRKFYVPKRYVFVLLAGFGYFNTYGMRVSLSVAMVAMVNQTAVSHFSSNISLHQKVECSNLVHDQPQNNVKEGFKGDQYIWDSKTQSRILGSFYYGFIITQIPGGILSKKIGFKWFYGGGVLITSVLSLITPFAASWGTLPLVIIRIIGGLGEGPMDPALSVAISKWSPKLERSRITTLICIGAFLGNVVFMPISGWLSSTDLFGGWPSVFYIFGCLGCIWFVFWCIFMHESPSVHPNISKEEFLLIELNKDPGIQKKSGTPLKSILTSPPMWGVIFSHFGYMFGCYVLLSEMPTYLDTILHYDLTSNGLLSSVPFMACAVTSSIASVIADKLREYNVMSITNIRRLCNSIGMFGPVFCFIGVTVSGCHSEQNVALLSLALALNGFIYSGFLVTPVDMSPDYAGTIFSISSTIANLSGFLAPMVVGYFTARGATLKNWGYIFYITAAIYAVCGSVFALFSSAELQPWGLSKDVTMDEKSEKSIKLTQTKK